MIKVKMIMKRVHSNPLEPLATNTKKKKRKKKKEKKKNSKNNNLVQ